MAEDEMVVWHYRLNGHEFEQALGDSERQGNLVRCSAWHHKQSATTERLNNSKVGTISDSILIFLNFILFLNFT